MLLLAGNLRSCSLLRNAFSVRHCSYTGSRLTCSVSYASHILIYCCINIITAPYKAPL